MSGAQQEFETVDGSGKKVAVVAARFHHAIVDRLVEGACSYLTESGLAAEDVEVLRVPGAWELPLALERLAQRKRYDGLVALGCVVHGETPHFDYVCTEASAGVSQVSLKHGLPIGFGLLTCETMAQAEARAGGEVGNKGQEAAAATLEMIELLARLDS